MLQTLPLWEDSWRCSSSLTVFCSTRKGPWSRTFLRCLCVSNCCPAEKSCVMDHPQSDLKGSCQHCCLERRLIWRYSLGKKSHRFQLKLFFLSIWCQKCKFQLSYFVVRLLSVRPFMLSPLCGCHNKGASQPVDNWSVSTAKLSFIWQIRQLFHYHQSSIIFINLPFVRTVGENEREPITEICSWQKIILNVVFLFSLVYIKEGSKTRTDFRVRNIQVQTFHFLICVHYIRWVQGCDSVAMSVFWFQNIKHWYHVVMFWHKMLWRTLKTSRLNGVSPFMVFSMF